MDMVEAVAMLNKRRGTKPIERWAIEINDFLAISGREQRIGFSTLYSYLKGHRRMTSEGAAPLAVYFHAKGDLEMVDAITQVTLGIPYKDGHRRKN